MNVRRIYSTCAFMSKLLKRTSMLKCGNFDKIVRRFSDENSLAPKSGVEKYKPFDDAESDIILDVDEERELRRTNPEQFHHRRRFVDEFEGMNLTRGKQGVFDVEELVETLRCDNAIDIFVARIPPEYKYVDYMVFVTGKSRKHMLAMAEFIRKYYKKKRHESDPIPRIEGKDSYDWIAMDLGNIALHILSNEAREFYKLESLWSIGPEYDIILNQKEDPLITLLEENTLLWGLNPKESSN